METGSHMTAHTTIIINGLTFWPNPHGNDNGNDTFIPLPSSSLKRRFQRCFGGPGGDDHK
jgi:hypothetical protein